jgi:hypothetical protein
MRQVVKFLRSPQFVTNKYFNFKSLPNKVIKRGFRCLIYLDDLLILLPAN